MSFSQTELVNAMRLLSTRLPQFPEQQNQVSRMLRIVTERLSSHLNENGYIIPGLGDAGDKIFGTR